MRSIGLSAVAAVFLAAPSFIHQFVAQSPPTALQSQVDTIFRGWTTTTPGCAVGASVKGQTFVRSAYGMADLERNVPNTPATVFDAGSVAKQFTAVAVLLLARDGKLSLDDTVHKYVPELPDYGVPITIRQMLHHTSGLREWNVLSTIAGFQYGMFESGYAQILDIQRRQRALNFEPGTRWSYSNSGYGLAAIIVSRVSGMPFADFTASRIFQPLGMTDTSWQQDVKRIVKNRALGYSERQGGAFAIHMPIVVTDGSGGLWTTVGDLLKWNENFVRPIVGDAALLRELQRNTTFVDGRIHEYAMGLVVDTYRGVPEADHGGSFAGYRAYISRYPDQQVSIAVLCNSATANPTAYGKALAQLLLGDALRAPGAAPAVSSEFSDADAERLAGMYRRSPQAGAIRIIRDGTALLFNGGSRLLPVSQTRLMRADNGDTMDFDGSGRARYVDEFGTVDVYERVEAAVPTVDQLRSLAGDYFSEEIDTTVKVTLEGNQLVIHRRGEKNALSPLYSDAFSGPIGEIVGVFVFERDSSGQVTALEVTHERVWNLKFVRQASTRQ